METSETQCAVTLLCLEETPSSEPQFGSQLAVALSQHGIPSHKFSIDGPLRDVPVTLTAQQVLWNEIDLCQTGVVFSERPLFLWPQPQLLAQHLSHPENLAESCQAEREAQSLLASSLARIANVRPVVPAIHAAEYAASPASALIELARKDLPVHPWALRPAHGNCGCWRLGYT